MENLLKPAQEAVKTDYLSTFAYYDAKGRRLSVFARMVDDNVMHIYTITCSKKDNFTKQKARLIFEGRDSKPLPHKRGKEEFIKLENNKFKWAFMNYCKVNYYKPMRATFTYTGYILGKGYDESKTIPIVLNQGLSLVDVKLVMPKEAKVEEKELAKGTILEETSH